MKKIFLTLSAIFLINIAFSQKDIVFEICGTKSELKEGKKGPFNALTISQEKLLECLEIKTNQKGVKVVAFSLGMTSSTGKEYYDIKTKGNKISEKMIEKIKEHNPSKIYIEKILTENKLGEASRSGHLTLHLK
jgi:hypothetical protein